MKRITYRKHFAIAALALAAATGAGAKTLVFCSEGSPENFYPGINTTGTSFDANSQIYSRIVDFERGGTRVVPGLAERWDISPDGKVYTIYLRKGVKWHNHRAYKPTRDFNADDMIFALERQWKETNPYFKVTSANHSYFNDTGLAKQLKSVEKVNDYTVRVTLEKPDAPFLSNLAMPMSLKYEWLELVTLKYGLSSLPWRSSMKIMSSALKSRDGLKFLFDCHLTPLRRWKG